MKKLVIIGNGFDLGHHIQTTFKEFIISNSNYSKKYELFRGTDWNKIEKNYKELLSNLMEQRENVDIAEKLEEIIYEYGYNEYGDLNYVHTTSDAFSATMEEIQKLVKLLDDFEKDFLKYLTEYFNDANIKKITSRNLIKDILRDSSWVINFNYTNVLEVIYQVTNVTHIHGDINTSDIAIGTDALENLKVSIIDNTYPTEIPCKNKHDFQDRMLYFEEDMDGNLVANEKIQILFDEINSSIKEEELELFEFLDKKNKEVLKSRKEVEERLTIECFDEVYIIGHSLGIADYSVFERINKRSKVFCYYYDDISSIEYKRMYDLLVGLGLEFELIPNGNLYC
ncbi:MAG: hypothetical protein EOM50_02140 [Erysipelotrichia bacterium]|nr:hypothetical protein [Erysipelotrichia bacterium]